MTGDVANMDTANCVPVIFCSVSYDTLTHISPEDGSIGPGLATSWEWTDDSRTVLRLTLREGVKFSDGTPLDAEAVAGSFTSYLSAPGPFAALGYPFQGAAAAGDDQVDITFAEPLTDEYALYLLSGQSGLSYIVNPAAAADRSLMVDETYGSGPYVLDSSQTTKGSKYVYVPNDNYYNQDAIHYEKVVYQPMQDPAARLNAIRSGQVSSATNISTADLATVESAGLTLSRGPLGKFATLSLSARDAGPLAEVKVRQALAFATPREDIATALYGESATPTSSFIPEGAQGYNEDDVDMYAYDPEKAKELLAEAGYADGFTISMFDPAFFDPGSALGQALKAAYAEVGVTLDLVPFDGSPGEVALQMGQYDSVILSTGANGISGAVYTLFRTGGLANPKNVPLDESLVSALNAAATAPDVDAQTALSMEATSALNELVYAVPIAGITTLIAVDPDVQNVPEQFWTIEANPFSPVTDEAWQGGGTE
ncbi:ABC transporter substrate-binding protein [Microbacterium timonense]|uniref:ABC transporter substrate-binding protein n=1 Tax=Microbacterium timonense TaxID=2086576 RepID=UPI00135A3CAC|nr:ABC transporter substrate-binding protein [Microbacterium timonense]